MIKMKNNKKLLIFFENIKIVLSSFIRNVGDECRQIFDIFKENAIVVFDNAKLIISELKSKKYVRLFQVMKKASVNALEISGLIYCFAIAFSASTGTLVVKIARLLLFFSFLLNIVRKNKIELYINKYVKWCLAFSIFAFASLLWTINSGNTISAFLSLLYIIICNLIVISITIKNNKYIYYIMKTVIFGSIIHGLKIFLFHGFNVYFNQRGGTIVENASVFSIVASFAFIFCIILLLKKEIKYKYFHYLITTLNIIFALLTASKKVLIFIPIFLIAYFLFSAKNRGSILIRIALFLDIVVIGYYLVMHIDFLYQLIGNRIDAALFALFGTKSDASTTFRIVMIKNGFEWFTHKPILGYGLDCFRYLLGNNIVTWAGTDGVYSHNNYIELLVNLGVIGLCIYYYLYANIIYNYFKQKDKNKNHIIAISLILSIALTEIGQVTYSLAFMQLVLLIIYNLMYCDKNEYKYIQIDVSSYINAIKRRLIGEEKYARSLGVKIGKGCEIYSGIIWGSEPYLIKIGNNVRITQGCKFVTHDGGLWVLRRKYKKPNIDKFGKITIGNNVHIGWNSIIMPGVKIGNNVVIGCGSIVTKDIPDNCVYAGVPAKKIEDIETYYNKIKDHVIETKNMSSTEKKKIIEKHLKEENDEK